MSEKLTRPEIESALRLYETEGPVYTRQLVRADFMVALCKMALASLTPALSDESAGARMREAAAKVCDEFARADHPDAVTVCDLAAKAIRSIPLDAAAEQWVCVPKEPSEERLRAMSDALDPVIMGSFDHHKSRLIAAYRVLTAAEQQPTSVHQSGGRDQ